jgi:hypothetical protein
MELSKRFNFSPHAVWQKILSSQALSAALGWKDGAGRGGLHAGREHGKQLLREMHAERMQRLAKNLKKTCGVSLVATQHTCPESKNLKLSGGSASCMIS